MSPTFEFVQTELVDRVGWLRFARPPVNAVTRAMAEETREAIRWLAGAPEVRVGVLGTAVEKYFSAGADLEAFVGIGGEGMRDWVAMTHEMAILLREAPKPLLAAIRGTAVGGGLEMALHCDLRFAAWGARFGQPEINIAFIPPIATTQALVRLIGRPASLRYLYEGRVHDAETALAMGLVDELVADADLEAHVQATPSASRPSRVVRWRRSAAPSRSAAGRASRRAWRWSATRPWRLPRTRTSTRASPPSSPSASRSGGDNG